MTAALQQETQDHARQPDAQGDEGGRGLPHPQAPARHQERNDAEDDAEQDRLAQVDGHGAAADGGGQPAQARQPTIRPGPTGIQGQQRQPTTGAGQAEELRHGEVPRPELHRRRERQRTVERRECPQHQTAQAHRDQQATVPLRMGEEVGVGQASANHRGWDDEGDEHLHDQHHGPLQGIGDDPEQRRCQRDRLLPGDRQGVAARQGPGGQIRRQGQHGDDARDEVEHRVVLAGQQVGQEDGDQPIGANDVAGEDEAVDESDQEHPPAAASHQAVGVDGGHLAGPGRLMRHRLATLRSAGKGGEVGLGPGGDAPVNHGHEPEAEEHREQRVGPVVHHQCADEHPPAVNGGHGRLGPVRHLVPRRNIGDRDEQEHEATGHVGGGVSHTPRTGEGGRHPHERNLTGGWRPAAYPPG